MRLGLALPLALVFGCAPTPTADSRAITGIGPVVSPPPLSAQDQRDICPPPPAFVDPSATAPPEDQFFISCRVYDDVDEGGWGVCCGGDLHVQTCGPGLYCWQPAADHVGVCGQVTGPVPWGPRDQTVCIDVWSPYQPPDDCGVIATRDDANDCVLVANCGNSQHSIYCQSGTCTCGNDAVSLANLPTNICNGSLADAIAAAQAHCLFPSDSHLSAQETRW